MMKFACQSIKVLSLLLCLLFGERAIATDPYTVELYETYCQACHSVASANTPVAFDQKAWSKRLEGGMAELVNSAIVGIGNMPAQGSCMECAYEDFEDLISYMASGNNE